MSLSVFMTLFYVILATGMLDGTATDPREGRGPFFQGGLNRGEIVIIFLGGSSMS